MAGEPDRDVRGTRRGGRELPTARLERTPLGPTRGNLTHIVTSIHGRAVLYVPE